MSVGAGPTLAQCFIARQPIFDRKLKVHAYELLFRSSLENFFDGSDLDEASSKVIADSALVMDLKTLTNGRRAFINCTAQTLQAGLIRLLPKNLTVIELLETIDPTPALIETCRQLKAEGFRLALDDFVYRESWAPLLELADVVKVDFLATSAQERETLTERLHDAGVRLLAEKVETLEMVDEARELGYSYFQGFFFSKPVIMSSNDVPGYKMHLLSVLREINRPELDFDGLERVIKQDMGLCYKLLRYINSIHFGFRSRIDSIRRALVMLGQNEIRKWANLVALTSIGRDQPEELLSHAIIRGRFCESLGPRFDLSERSQDLFLTGIFSMLDSVLGRPLNEVLDSLPLNEDIKQALRGSENDLGRVLRYSQAYERGDWQALGSGVEREPEAEIARMYIDAAEWATRSLKAGLRDG